MAADSFSLMFDGGANCGKTTLINHLRSSTMLSPYSIYVCEGGDMFRAVAAQTLEENPKIIESDEFDEWAENMMAQMDYFKINRPDLRTPEVARLLPRMIQIEALREICTKQFKHVFETAPADIVIASSRAGGHFVDTDLKFWLEADFDKCSERGVKQLRQKDLQAGQLRPKEYYIQAGKDIMTRNETDAKIWAPNWGPAPGAHVIYIDRDHLASEDVLQQTTKVIEPALQNWQQLRYG